MASLQFRSDDTYRWEEGFGRGSSGATTISSNTGFESLNIGYGTCSGTAGNRSMSVTAVAFCQLIVIGDPILIYDPTGSGVGTWQLNVAASNFPAAGSATVGLKYPLTFSPSGAMVQRMPQFTTLTIASGKNLSIADYDGSKYGTLAFFAFDTNVSGNLLADGAGYRGGQSVSQQAGNQGEGQSGAGYQSTSANGVGGGGGYFGVLGSSAGSGGGGGGYATSGTNGSAQTGSVAVGSGGGTVGDAALASLYFGGAGGSGGGVQAAPGTDPGDGGAGGGNILIFSKNITVSGLIASRGDAGENAESAIFDASAGGGGAGGSILIKCDTATLGSSKVLATGGVGGTSGGGGSNGGAGGVGRIHLDYSTSYTGTTSPSIDVRQDTSLLYRAIYGGMI